MNSCTYVVRASEEEKYRAAGITSILTAPDDEINSLAKVRQWIVDNMTGPGSESQQPCREWVERIVDDAKNELSPFYPIPVFMKDNLRKVWGRDLIQEFPEKLEAQR